MLKDSFEHAGDDLRIRALREQQVEAERMLVSVLAALEQDEGLLDATELAAIHEGINCLRSQSQRADHRAIKSAIDELNRLTEPFAARRMDRSVRQALKGKNLASL